MLAAVIPAKDEQGRIGYVLRNLLRLPLDLIIPVVNGCRDRTWERVQSVRDRRIHALGYPFPLGLDVPRAAGAFHAYARGAKAVLFVDGDMVLEMNDHLRSLLAPVALGQLDMALTDTYPDAKPRPGTFAGGVAGLRRELNAALGLSDLEAASPSHGPHAVSRRLLEQVPFEALAIPPVSLAMAVRAGLRVGVGAARRHGELGSDPRTAQHRKRIGETIMGDCLEAICVARGEPRSRCREGMEYLGFHPHRRMHYIFPGAQEDSERQSVSD